MRKLIVITLIIFWSSMATASQISVIPKPMEIEDKSGFFRLTNATVIFYSQNSSDEAGKLRDYLQPATGYALRAAIGTNAAANTIILRIDPDLPDLGKEGYLLDVLKDRIIISSGSNAGLFYGIQTLRQLLPAEIYSDVMVKNDWKIPCVSIKDRSSYPWRGMMLDVSRYFFNKDYVKRYLEIMAMHKLNVLQLHLVDDPGWRVQIDKYPKLTEVGGFRGKRVERYGGYYTKGDIREIIDYARKLHIDIVPEIELPAHCQSALVAYPWLGCSDKQFEMPTKCYISREILCAGKESTYRFLKDVMSEVVEMFPGKYIHIGGDEAKYDRWKECPHCKKKMQKEGLKDFHELQSYMTRQMEKFLMSKGRRLIGWDEILNGGLAPNATVMTWHRPETAVKAAKSGNNVVMALTSNAYFDAPESKLPGEPPAATWLPPISLRKAYEWEPAPAALNEQEKKFILGGQGCLWTDRFMHNPILQDLPVLDENRSFRYVDYLSLPRMAALGEVVWTPQSLRSWKDFQKRAGRHYNRYSACKYNYRVPQPIVHQPVKSADQYIITLTSPVNGAKILYTMDGSNPTNHSTIYTNPVTVDELYKFRAITVVSERHFSLPFAFEEDSSKKYAKEIR